MVMDSGLGVIKTIEDRWSDVNTIYYGLEVRGEVGTSHRLWRLQPSQLWKDSSKGADKVAVGRRFRSETVQQKKG